MGIEDQAMSTYGVLASNWRHYSDHVMTCDHRLLCGPDARLQQYPDQHGYLWFNRRHPTRRARFSGFTFAPAEYYKDRRGNWQPAGKYSCAMVGFNVVVMSQVYADHVDFRPNADPLRFLLEFPNCHGDVICVSASLVPISCAHIEMADPTIFAPDCRTYWMMGCVGIGTKISVSKRRR